MKSFSVCPLFSCLSFDVFCVQLIASCPQGVAGQFDQTFNFVVVDSGLSFPVHARGVAEFPAFKQSPKALFGRAAVSQSQRDPQGLDALVFDLDKQSIEFGPLLSGKSREDFKGEPHPANVFKMTIRNPRTYAITVHSALEKDASFATFHVDPPTMQIAAGETQQLRVFAYPKDAKHYEDTLVMTTRDNPDAFSCSVHVEGVSPTLEVENKTIQFDRVLLRRTNTKMLRLVNPCKLAVAWQLVGHELLGEELTLPVTEGIIDPLSDLQVPMHFHSLRPMSLKKVTLTLFGLELQLLFYYFSVFTFCLFSVFLEFFLFMSCSLDIIVIIVPL